MELQDGDFWCIKNPWKNVDEIKKTTDDFAVCSYILTVK